MCEVGLLLSRHPLTTTKEKWLCASLHRKQLQNLPYQLCRMLGFCFSYYLVADFDAVVVK